MNKRDWYIVTAIVVGILTLWLLLGRAGATDAPQNPPQKLTKVESMALQLIQNKQDEINREYRELALEICRGHSIPVETCKIDPASLEVSRLVEVKPPVTAKDSTPPAKSGS